MFEPLVESALFGADHPLDPSSGGEHVGDDLVARTLYVREPEQGVAAIGGQFPYDRTHVLVQRDRGIDDEDVLGMGGRIVVEESAEVLAGHGLLPSGDRHLVNSSWSMGNWSNTLPTVWSIRSSMVSGEW